MFKYIANVISSKISSGMQCFLFLIYLQISSVISASFSLISNKGNTIINEDSVVVNFLLLYSLLRIIHKSYCLLIFFVLIICGWHVISSFVYSLIFSFLDNTIIINLTVTVLNNHRKIIEIIQHPLKPQPCSNH